MFYKYWTKQNLFLRTNQLLSNRPAGPASDLNYFRNEVSHLLKLFSIKQADFKQMQLEPSRVIYYMFVNKA